MAEVRDRHVQVSEAALEELSCRGSTVQGPCGFGLRGVQEAPRTFPQDVELRVAARPIRSEMHEILEELSFPHGVVAVPAGKLELGDATISLNVEGT